MKIPRLFWFAILPILLLTPTGSPAWQSAGQTSGAQSSRPQTTIRANVSLVNVIFTATDRSGKVVAGLKAEDFILAEDRKSQTIDYFSDWTQGSDIPLTIALLLDTSGSVKTKLDFEKRTASEFFRNILRQDKDLALILQFDSDVNLVQDFTQDPDRLTAALDSIRAGNSTALYDAVYLAVEEKLKQETGRKVIIVITDGTDTSSKVKEKEAIEVAQRNDVIIYGIGVRGTDAISFDVLKGFAQDTGGQFFSPGFKLEEIRAAFKAIGADLQGQYSLAYRSTNTVRDGSYRRIDLRCKLPGISVRARKGYYAPSAK
jgi:VWFA-related protein